MGSFRVFCTGQKRKSRTFSLSLSLNLPHFPLPLSPPTFTSPLSPPALLPPLFLSLETSVSSFSSSLLLCACCGEVVMKEMGSQMVSSYFQGGEENRSRFKYQCLRLDYEELLMETEEKKLRLQKALQRKHKLFAEVKFLRSKYQQLSNSSQLVQCKVKKHSHKISSCNRNRVPRYQNTANQSELSLKDGIHKPKQVSVLNVTPLLDLNQDMDEVERFEEEWNPLKMFSREDDLLVNDAKISICREFGSGLSGVGKRKVTWQDQLALRV
ncbi:hypothetical protein AXF42_Ash018582 [Apostasia shenzhenica]|uniref:Uncharacterized protein n=1 Tax=Apostasia shenzhenica TaxID=1088818 RepID=A0A2I0APW9_9ASPA|nr:hypothetical protein AXF42_Ash018582 [Apostasia shenzhenica]